MQMNVSGGGMYFFLVSQAGSAEAMNIWLGPAFSENENLPVAIKLQKIPITSTVIVKK